MALRHDTCNATDMSNLGRRTFRIVRYITCDGYSNVTLLRSLGGYTLALARRSVATHVHHARRTMRGDSLQPQDPTFRRNFSAAIGSCDDDDFISPQRVQCGHQSLKVGRSLDSWEDQARSLTQVRSHSIWVWVGRRFWELFLKRAKLTRLGRTRPVLR